MVMKSSQVHQSIAMVSGQISTLQIPTGGKIHDLFLVFLNAGGTPNTDAQVRSEITGNIRLTIGGKDIINVPLARLLDLNLMMGNKIGSTTSIGGVVQLNLGRLLYVDPIVKDLFGWGTADVNSIQVQVTAGTLSTVVNLQAFSTREAVNERLGSYFKMIDFPRNFNATGDDTIDTLPRDLNSAYAAVLINAGAAGVIKNSEVKVNGQLIRERMPQAVIQSISNQYGIVTNAADAAGEGKYAMHLFADGALGSYLPMKNVTDLRLLTNFSTAPGAAGYFVTPITLNNFGGT